MRFLLTLLALIFSVVYELLFSPAFCAYCFAIRVAFISLLMYYLLFNSLVIANKWNIYESIIESFLIICCFSASSIALLAKYGMLNKWFFFCGSAAERGCFVNYSDSILDLKVAAFITATSILILKLVDNYL